MTPSAIAIGAKRGGGRGEERDGEAQQAVSAGLQEQAGEDDAAGGRRFGMSIRQPGMKRHAGSLTANATKNAEHEPHLRRRAELHLEPARNSRMSASRSGGN